jgi:hypothetical protein
MQKVRKRLADGPADGIPFYFKVTGWAIKQSSETDGSNPFR